MRFATLVMKKTTKELLKKQLLITMVVAIFSAIIVGVSGFYAALYGGSITMIATIIMAWRINRIAHAGAQDKNQAYLELTIGVVQKFILTLILFAFGMGWLKLSPLIMIIAFILTQASYMFNQVNTSYLQS